MVTRFEDLHSWQEARKLVTMTYKMTRSGMIACDWGLRDQLRRASLSVMSNIAEGFGRKSDKEFIRYLEISNGSLNEVKSILYASSDLGYVGNDEIKRVHESVDLVRAMNRGLIRYLASRMK